MTKPIPINPTRDAILKLFDTHPKLETYSKKRPEGTKYISGFKLKGTDKILAVDKNIKSKQPIFILYNETVKLALDRESISYEKYPKGKSRNSNLHKFSGFKKDALLRTYPQSVTEAETIIAILSK